MTDCSKKEHRQWKTLRNSIQRERICCLRTDRCDDANIRFSEVAFRAPVNKRKGGWDNGRKGIVREEGGRWGK